MEEPDVRKLAIDDPRAFLDQLSEGGILDEVQRAPEILSYLQTHVDQKGRMGLFLLIGLCDATETSKFPLQSLGPTRYG